MSNAQQPAVEIRLSFGDGDVEYLDRQTRLLQRDLNAIGVPADVVREESAPDGARGAAEIIGLLQVGALLPVVVPKLMDMLQSWLASRKGSVIRIKVGDLEVEAQAGDVEAARALLADVERAARTRATS